MNSIHIQISVILVVLTGMYFLYLSLFKKGEIKIPDLFTTLSVVSILPVVAILIMIPFNQSLFHELQGFLVQLAILGVILLFIIIRNLKKRIDDSS